MISMIPTTFELNERAALGNVKKEMQAITGMRQNNSKVAYTSSCTFLTVKFLELKSAEASTFLHLDFVNESFNSLQLVTIHK